MTAAAVTEDRRTFLGGSDMGAILGVDPYKTRLQLYEEKVGITLPFTGSRHTQRGNRLEDVAVEEFEQRQSVRTNRVNKRWSHPVYPFIAGRIDRRIIGRDEIVEVKCPSLGSFSRIKRTGLHEGYIAQMQSYLGLTQRARGWWSVFCADQWEAVDFPVDFDADLYNGMVDRAVSFWYDHVVPRVPPSPTQEDAERIEIARVAGTQERYDMTGDVEFANAAKLLAEAKQLTAEGRLIEEEARTKLTALAGGRRGVFVTPDYRISYTMQAGRSSFDEKALANVKPLDRLKVVGVLAPLFASGGVIFEELVKAVGDGRCDVDLSEFRKQGKPFDVLRLTAGGGE